MSLLELKLTVLEDSLKKYEDKWRRDYINYHWKFDTNKIREGINMTKKEQLKEVFTKEVKKLMGDHETALVDNVIVPIQSVVDDTVNTLLKEVTIRFK